MQCPFTSPFPLPSPAEFTTLSPADKATAWSMICWRNRQADYRDTSNLSPQLIGLEGYRVEVITIYGETRRFQVARSMGWRPCHLELHNRRSSGGASAEAEYTSVRVIRSA